MTALPPPTRTADVATDLGTVRAYLWSSPSAAGRTPVLLLPGRTSGVPMWSENLAGLLAHHSVIAVDALGDAGLSVQSTPLTSIEDQAIWIDEVVRRLAPDGVHLVGHSFGGSTAATYARLHPERVSSLVLLEPVFTFGYPPAGLLAWTVLASLPVLPESWRERALAEVGGGERADPDDPIATMISAGAAHYSAQLPNPRLLTDAQLAGAVHAGLRRHRGQPLAGRRIPGRRSGPTAAGRHRGGLARDDALAADAGRRTARRRACSSSGPTERVSARDTVGTDPSPSHVRS